MSFGIAAGGRGPATDRTLGATGGTHPRNGADDAAPFDRSVFQTLVVRLTEPCVNSALNALASPATAGDEHAGIELRGRIASIRAP